MKKFWSTFFLAMLLSAQMALAQSVMVSGVGSDREAAMRDAERNAVESVAGVYIDAQALMHNLVVQLDDVYTKAQGFVTQVNVISEAQEGAHYRVQARIDVDTNPDSALMNRLQTIVQLNDPRIAVVILDEEAKEGAGVGYDGHDNTVETALNAQLLQMGFSHVVDANHVSQLQNSQALNDLSHGVTRLSSPENARPLDYLVLGKCSADAYTVKVPNYQGSYNETNMQSATAELNIKVINYATGAIVSTYVAEGQGADNTPNLATKSAKKEAAQQAAQQLETKFRKLAAKPFQGVALSVTFHDMGQEVAFQRMLKNIAGIHGVQVREARDGHYVYDVDSAQKPYALGNLLRSQDGWHIFIEKVSNSELQLIVN